MADKGILASIARWVRGGREESAPTQAVESRANLTDFANYGLLSRYMLNSSVNSQTEFAEEQRLLDFFFRQNNPNLLKRDEYYQSIRGLYTAEPNFSGIILTYLAEVMPPSTSQKPPIEVLSKKLSLVRYVETEMERLGMDYSFFMSIFDHILMRGDCWVRLVTEREGNKDRVANLVVLSPETVRVPLQFTMSELIDAARTNFQSLVQLFPDAKNMTSSTELKKDVIDLLQGKVTPSNLFRGPYSNVNLGCILVNGEYVPPWQIVRFTHSHPLKIFFPFNESYLHNTISPCASFSQQKLLHSIARMANIPMEVWKLKAEASRRPEEAMTRIADLSSKLDSAVFSKEQYTKNSGVGRRLYVTPDFDFEMVSPNLNVDDVADLDFYQTEISFTSAVPKAYRESSEFQSTSGIALARMHQPFRKRLIDLQMSVAVCADSLLRTIGFVEQDDKLLQGKYSYRFYLPPVEGDSGTKDDNDKLEQYTAFLEKTALIAGYETVAELPSEVRLSALNIVYQDYDRDAVYNLIYEAIMKGDKELEKKKADESQEGGEEKEKARDSFENQRLGEALEFDKKLVEASQLYQRHRV